MTRVPARASYGAARKGRKTGQNPGKIAAVMDLSEKVRNFENGR
jgi:hypothetical protein